MDRTYVERTFTGFWFQLQLVGHSLHSRQPDKPQQFDITPTEVKLPPFIGELGGSPMSMVVVMQFFTTDDDAPGHNIGTGIGAGKVTIANRVANAIHHARGPKWDPGHLYRPHGDANGPKQGQVNHQHNANAQEIMTTINIAL